MKKTMKKMMQGLPNPVETRLQAEVALATMGELQREIALATLACEESIGVLKKDLAEKTSGLKVELKQHLADLSIYAQAHRLALCPQLQKTVFLSTGTLSWRNCPPRVQISNHKKALVSIKEQGLSQFVRVNEEVDKAAILADPKKAANLEGITVKSQGEVFAVAPNHPQSIRIKKATLAHEVAL